MKRWFGAVWALLALASPARAFDDAKLASAIQAEEAKLGARIGVAALDKANGARFGYHADERFPLLSTHKVFACATLLSKVDRGEASLQRRVVLTEAQLVSNSPVTEKHIAPDSMSLAEHCAAAIDYSDNSAANAVLAAIGGPAALTAFFRTLDDETSRLDRIETELNEAAPGDISDTTTPAAAVADLEKIILGDVLKPTSRERLKQWMIDDRVAGALLRATLPSDWTIADKTGSGERGSRGIVAVLWPPTRAPVVVAIYLRDTQASLDERNAAISRIGAALRRALSPP